LILSSLHFEIRIPKVRAVAVSGIVGPWDPRAVEPLIAALQDTDSNVRDTASFLLGTFMDPRSVAPLIATLKDTDANVRMSAAWALGKTKDPRAVEPLIAALEDTDVGVRGSAALALGEIKDRRAVGPLIALLKSRTAGDRNSAARALGEIRDRRAANALQAAFKRRDAEAIVGSHNFFIERGEPGSEDVLINALEESGTISMADDFLSCGNAKLEEAARTWAKDSGHVVRRRSGAATWGSARQAPLQTPKN